MNESKRLEAMVHLRDGFDDGLNLPGFWSKKLGVLDSFACTLPQESADQPLS
jgi:hypothetical protein